MMKNSKHFLTWRDYHLSNDCIWTLRAMDKLSKMNAVTLLGHQSIFQLMESLGIRTISLSDINPTTLAFLTETELETLFKRVSMKLSPIIIDMTRLRSSPLEYKFQDSIFDAPCYWSMTAMRTNSPTD